MTGLEIEELERNLADSYKVKEISTDDAGSDLEKK